MGGWNLLVGDLGIFWRCGDCCIYLCGGGAGCAAKPFDAMKYVNLPDDMPVQRLPFYLAMEEYVARELEPCDYFFMWQVRPTVIFGRNQIIDNEVNVDYCRANGIEMYRRRSGGGCVFADMSNVMLSYVTSDSSAVATTFERYTTMVADMLRSMGVDASSSSRNDILIGDRKVSGNAFYHIPGRSIVHGTMLYDTDMAHMAQAITPSVTKLQAKGVQSVRSRITTLHEHTRMDIEQFKTHARRSLCETEITLTPDDVKAIRNLEEPYYNPEWIYGRRHKASTTLHRRVEGVGEFEVDVAVDRDNRITDVNLSGDFFLTADMDSLLINPLKQVTYSPESIRDALKDITTENVIHGLTKDEFIKILF